jgi:hypothetical protein
MLPIDRTFDTALQMGNRGPGMPKKLTVKLLVIAASINTISASGLAAEIDPPKEYCQLQDRYAAIDLEASERFPDVSTNDRWLERKNWISEQSDEASDKFSQTYGKPYQEWFTIAFENNWTQACDAAKTDWLVIRKDAVTSIDSSHVARVKDAVNLEYFTRLGNGVTDTFFDPDRYSAVNCTDAEVDGFTFIGCKLRSIEYQTDRDIFLVAVKDGVPVAVPYSHEARDRVAGQRRTGVGRDKVELGYYIGELPLVDYPTLVNALD